MNISAEDKGLYLREIEYDDTPLILKWRNSEEVRSRFIDRRIFTKESHEAWLKNVIGSGRAKQFIICISPEGDALLVACRDNDRVQLFFRDPLDGSLSLTEPEMQHIHLYKYAMILS